MAYTRNPTWQDYDGTDDTLITAAKLENIEQGIVDAAQGVGVSTVWAGSQAAYDAISTPDPDTLYFVTG